MNNLIILLGNLTRDPEMMTTQSGKNKTTFSIAVDRPKQKDKDVITDFINIQVWNKLAENCYKFLKKGNKVQVTGSLCIDNYEKDGVKKQSVYVLSNDVIFLTQKPQSTETQSTQPAQQQSIVQQFQPIDDSNLPF